MIQIIIKFNDAEGTQLLIKSPAYIPNIGDTVHNKNEAMSFFTVTRKDVYYSPDINITNIIINADKK
jgi:hypothetical protein